MVLIENINDTRIAAYKSLKDTSKSLNRENLFIAEGLKVCKRLLESDLEVVSCLMTSEYHALLKNLIMQKISNCQSIYIAEKSIMEQIIGFSVHSGIMAIGKTPNQSQISELSDKLIILNGIIDSENVGSIIRNATGFDYSSVIYDNATSSPFLRRAVRVSMGSIFDFSHLRSRNLIEDLINLKNLGYTIISAEICENSIDLTSITKSGRFAIVFGNESKGVSHDILELSDLIIKIPISNRIPSLNVAASSAILLYSLQNK